MFAKNGGGGGGRRGKKNSSFFNRKKTKTKKRTKCRRESGSQRKRESEERDMESKAKKKSKRKGLSFARARHDVANGRDALRASFDFENTISTHFSFFSVLLVRAARALLDRSPLLRCSGLQNISQASLVRRKPPRARALAPLQS